MIARIRRRIASLFARFHDATEAQREEREKQVAEIVAAKMREDGEKLLREYEEDPKNKRDKAVRGWRLIMDAERIGAGEEDWMRVMNFDDRRGVNG